MKVSVNWLKQFVDIDIPLPKLLDRIGTQLGAVEQTTDLGIRYKGIVVVRVVTCEPHPDASKLLICRIDDGGVVKNISRDAHGFVQIVTGATNVRPGLLAVWLPPGSLVPNHRLRTDAVLESRQIRGVVSDGMLASAKELELGDDHGGLLEVDEDIAVGTTFAKAYQLDDQIIDIENKMFTHRPDLFGIIGVAREIAAITDKNFNGPSWYKESVSPIKSSDKQYTLEVKNQILDQVPRFSAIVLSGVQVGPSPLWLRSHLIRAGIRPINNVVDLTNFVMYETGQPLHAYDYDKIKDGTIVIRNPKNGEEINLLDGQVIKPIDKAVIIADKQTAIGLGGVMGSANTEVDDQTKNIVLEAANFSMSSIRASAMAHGLFTEAAIRFTKNQSPWQTVPVLAKLVDDVIRVAGGQVASSLVDVKSNDLKKPKSIKVQPSFINERLGLQLNTTVMTEMLRKVEMNVDASAKELSITPPFWRTDIAIAEDIVEEIGRLHGYDNLVLKLPSRDLRPVKPNSDFEFATKLRRILAAAGGNEVLTYSFVHGSLIDKAGQNREKALKLRNALSPNLQYYRLSLSLSLLEKVRPNLKAGFEAFMLFEIGLIHLKTVLDDSKLPKINRRLAFVLANKTTPENRGSAYFAAKKVVDYIASQLGGVDFTYHAMSEKQALSEQYKQVAGSLEPNRSAIIKAGTEIIGAVGEPSMQIRQALKLPAYCSLAELDMSALKASAKEVSYKPLNRFPYLHVDVCFEFDLVTAHNKLQILISDFLSTIQSKDGIEYSLEPIDIFMRDSVDGFKRSTWRIRLWHPDKTLTSREANDVVKMLEKQAKQKLQARIV